MLWRIGLTGGIGSGKSTVAQMLSDLGAQIIDADAISRQSTGPGGAALAAIGAQFGSAIVCEKEGLNRATLRELIFSDASARKQLEAIVHPLVRLEMQRQAQAATAACLVFDIPLLAESSHWRSELDRVLVVDCSAEVQTVRTMARDGSSRASVELAIAAQSSRQARLAIADACIHNGFETSLTRLRLQVAQYAQSFGL